MITVYDSGVKNVDQRLLFGTPTTGTIRMEWALARMGMIIPTNWSQSYIYPPLAPSIVTYGYGVADAQNICVHHAVAEGFEWLLLYEHDMLPPPDTLIRLNEYMRNADTPVVSGLYYTRSRPSEPLVYRGRGNSYFDDWEFGDKVWCDGVPTGFLLVHSSLLHAMYDASEPYTVFGTPVRRVFDVPMGLFVDPETHAMAATTGTSDLAWCDRVMAEDWLLKAGWADYNAMEFPFLVDTNIFLAHINPNGEQFPRANPWELLLKNEPPALGVNVVDSVETAEALA